MKLFIWDDPWRVTYGKSMIMVLAEDLESARTTLRARGYCDYDPNDSRHFLHREPDEVLERGYTTREWSE